MTENKTNRNFTQKKAEELKSQLQNIQSQLQVIEAQEEQKYKNEGPGETLLQWEAPERVVTPKSRIWYVLVSFGFVLAIAFAVLTQDWLLILVLVALMALIYVSNNYHPKIIEHEVSSKGIVTGGNLYPWRNVDGFWISKKGKYHQLIVDLDRSVTPNRLILPLGQTTTKTVVETVERFAPYFNKVEIGQDILNLFSTGEYVPLSHIVLDKSTKTKKDEE